LLYVYHPSDAFSRRAVAPDALDLFLKELRPLPDDAPFDFVFAVAPTLEEGEEQGASAARAAALLARLDDAVKRLQAPLDIGPVVESDGEEILPPSRLRYGVIAGGAAAAVAGAANNHRHRDRHPWGWSPAVLASWPDLSAMRLVRVWAEQPQEQEQEQEQEEGGAMAAAASFRPAAADAAAAAHNLPPLLTATRLGSRFPWLLPGFLPHPDDDGPPNATLTYPLAAVGREFVRRACAAVDDDGDDNNNNETLGDPRDAVVLIPFAYGSSPEADAGCTYWHVLRAAQQELGAAGALFHAPLLPAPSPSSLSSSPSVAAAIPPAPPTAPGGLEEQLFQPSYVPWPGFDAPPFDEDADPGPEEGGAELPAASVERAAAAAIRAALLRSSSSGGSSPSSAVRAGFIARPLPAGAAALAVDARGRVQEVGWLKLPSLEHAAWAARYLSWREKRLDRRLDELIDQEAQGNALVVPVLGGDGDDDASRPLSADKGRVSASVELPPASQLARFSKVEADFELDCLGGVDASCPQWDHVLQTFVCCSSVEGEGLSSSWRRPACSPSPSADCWGTKWRRANPAVAAAEDDEDDNNAANDGPANACGRELLRVVTPFRRRGGRWLVDVTRLRGLLHPPAASGSEAADDAPITCAFHVQGPPWAGPWVPRLALRFSQPIAGGGGGGGGGGGVSTAEAVLSSASTPSASVHVKALWPTAPGTSYDVSESPPGGGNCDTSGAHPPAPLPPPPPPGTRLARATLVAAVTGHGAAEFVPSTHAFYLEQREGPEEEEEEEGDGGPRPRRRRRVHLLTADLASYRPGGIWGSGSRGCVSSVDAGSVPNEHGTWLYTRAGWCDGGPADGPWAADVTAAVREAWRQELLSEEEEGGVGGSRARIAYGCVFPSGGWGQEEELRVGRRGQVQRRRRQRAEGGEGAASAPADRSVWPPGARRRLLDEPDAAFMMEATLVLEYEREEEGAGPRAAGAEEAAATAVV
jgi:hypothetical protein